VLSVEADEDLSESGVTRRHGEPLTETESETDLWVDTEAVTGPLTEAGAETEPLTEHEAETEPLTEGEAETEPLTEAEAEAEAEAETEPEMEAGAKTGDLIGAGAEAGADLEPETDAGAESAMLREPLVTLSLGPPSVDVPRCEPSPVDNATEPGEVMQPGETSKGVAVPEDPTGARNEPLALTGWTADASLAQSMHPTWAKGILPSTPPSPPSPPKDAPDALASEGSVCTTQNGEAAAGSPSVVQAGGSTPPGVDCEAADGEDRSHATDADSSLQLPKILLVDAEGEGRPPQDVADAEAPSTPSETEPSSEPDMSVQDVSRQNTADEAPGQSPRSWVGRLPSAVPDTHPPEAVCLLDPESPCDAALSVSTPGEDGSHTDGSVAFAS